MHPKSQTLLEVHIFMSKKQSKYSSDYYNNKRISFKLNGMSPVQYRAHSQNI